jgi:hypothetical protein
MQEDLIDEYDFEDGEIDDWLSEQEMAADMEEHPHMLIIDDL